MQSGTKRAYTSCILALREPSQSRHPAACPSCPRFTFARPDLELLRDFCASRLGMEPGQVQELLAPVVASWEARQAQQTLDQYLQFRWVLDTGSS